MKEYAFSGIVAIISSFIVSLFGNPQTITTLFVLISLMVMDYATGVIVAGVFKNSAKSCTGTLSSDAGLKGLAKKGVIIFVVIAAFLLDYLANTSVIGMATMLMFCVNEIISLIENAGLMGIPIPSKLKKAIEVLTEKNE
jgi:toxin secretion/phage lysis holin